MRESTGKSFFNADSRKSNADLRRFIFANICDHLRVICEYLRSRRIFQQSLRRGLTTLEVFIFIGIIALVASLLLKWTFESKVKENERQAFTTLKTIVSTALENYAKDHNGTYPASEKDLVSLNQTYLNRMYNGQVTNGYAYKLELSPGGYNLQAVPVTCGAAGTGRTAYTVTTGGIVKESLCVAVQNERQI